MIHKLCISLVLSVISLCAIAQNNTDCNKQTHRIFKHTLLVGKSVCLPKNIKRVVALDIGAAEISILTGHQIVGAPNWLLSEMHNYHPNWAKTLEKIQDVGIPANLEKIIGLKPDVILAVGKSEYTHKLIDIEKARNIAPVIAADSVIYRDWKKSMQFWSAALGEDSLYDKMQTNYQARIAELKSRLQKKWNTNPTDIDQELRNKKVSVASITSQGMYMWLPLTPTSAILRDIGFGRPNSQNLSAADAVKKYKNDSYAKIGKEYLSLLDGDFLFAFAYASHDPNVIKKEKKVWEDLKSRKLWKRLKVVRNKQAYYVSNAWFRSTTYILANRVIDDIALSITGRKLSQSVMDGIK